MKPERDCCASKMERKLHSNHVDQSRNPSVNLEVVVVLLITVDTSSPSFTGGSSVILLPSLHLSPSQMVASESYIDLKPVMLVVSHLPRLEVQIHSP